MKCKCPSCSSKLQISDSQLRRLKIPVFSCPKCETKLNIKPSIAKCGNCNISFAYRRYKFADNPGVVKCNACEAINRIKFKS